MSNRSAQPGRAPEVIRTADFTRSSNEYLREQFPDSVEGLMQSSLLLLRLATAFQQSSERHVHRPLRLRWSGFSTVFALSIFGRLEARSLARIVGVSRQAISLVITSLERDGFIVRRTGEDRRTLVIELTDRGKEVSHEALRGQVNIAKEWFEVLAPEELSQLTSLLEKVLNGRSGAASDEQSESPVHHAAEKSVQRS